MAEHTSGVGRMSRPVCGRCRRRGRPSATWGPVSSSLPVTPGLDRLNIGRPLRPPPPPSPLPLQLSDQAMSVGSSRTNPVEIAVIPTASPAPPLPARPPLASAPDSELLSAGRGIRQGDGEERGKGRRTADGVGSAGDVTLATDMHLHSLTPRTARRQANQHGQLSRYSQHIGGGQE